MKLDRWGHHDKTYVPYIHVPHHLQSLYGCITKTNLRVGTSPRSIHTYNIKTNVHSDSGSPETTGAHQGPATDRHPTGEVY